MDGGSSGAGADPNELRRGSCLAAVFLARNRFAVLDKNRQVGNAICPVLILVFHIVYSVCRYSVLFYRVELLDIKRSSQTPAVCEMVTDKRRTTAAKRPQREGETP